MQRVTGGRRLAAKSWAWLEEQQPRGAGVPTVGSAADGRRSTLRFQMRDQQLDLEVSRRVHLLVGLAIERGLGAQDLVALAAEMFTTWPTTKALAPSVRLRCVTAAATYLSRCRPVGFTLVGVDESLGRGVADLVWSKGHTLLVDELEIGNATPNDADLCDRVVRLVEGGRTRWDRRFVGVRVLPLAAVREAWFMASDGSVEAPIGSGTLEVH